LTVVNNYAFFVLLLLLLLSEWPGFKGKQPIRFRQPIGNRDYSALFWILFNYYTKSVRIPQRNSYILLYILLEFEELGPLTSRKASLFWKEKKN